MPVNFEVPYDMNSDGDVIPPEQPMPKPLSARNARDFLERDHPGMGGSNSSPDHPSHGRGSIAFISTALGELVTGPNDGQLGVNRDTVHSDFWLTPEQRLDGLAQLAVLRESLPGARNASQK